MTADMLPLKFRQGATVSYTGPLARLREIRIVVYGVPQPAGSKSHFAIKAGPKGNQHFTGKIGIGDGRTVASRERHKSWRSDVTECAAEALAGEASFTGPVEVWFTFSMPRPKNHYSTSRKLPPNSLLDSAPLIPETKPDGDKLQRSVQDSLTDAGVFKDDNQVARWHGAKEYARDAAGQSPHDDILPRPGVVIRVRALTS